ncbi:MAG: PIN domain-containing protein [Caldilinea sp. CFX5]|nr:PIN domain-containing protein [Caldilinea sp. CFX5]
MAPLTAFLDANVLYPAGLRNLLLRLATQGLFQAKWSASVHEEWIRNVLADRPQITHAMLERTRQLMDANVEDSLVQDYETLAHQLTLPDPDDRHVLAAAIVGKADLIVTFNLRDFPATALHPYHIEAQHPDLFIIRLMEMDMANVCVAASKHRLSLQNPPKRVHDYLASLERHGLSRTVARLREYASLI